MISDLLNCDTLRIEQTGSLSSDSIKCDSVEHQVWR